MASNKEYHEPADGVVWCLAKNPSGFQAGVSVDGAHWNWLFVEAKTWPTARKRAPALIGQLLYEYAENLRIQAGKLGRRADELTELQARVVRGKEPGDAR